MKALCVTPDRKINLRDVVAPMQAPAGHLLIDIEANVIQHGDITFLARPELLSLAPRPENIWGASGAGRVIAVGEGVSARYVNRKVAIYRSLSRTPQTLGLWSERAIATPTSTVILPEEVDARDYAGSLVNVFTALAFLDEAAAEGHKAVVATLGASQTGRALLALAKSRGVPALLLARSDKSVADLKRLGAEHVLSTSDENFESVFAETAAKLNATAIFDGVGGDLVGRLAPIAAPDSTFYFYGFLGGPKPIAVPTVVFMSKNLTMKRFSNFMTRTAMDPAKLAAALEGLESVIADPLFRTPIGAEFRYEDFEAALAYASPDGSRPAIIP